MDQDSQQQIEELLAQLHDVQVADIKWWPPAPGWWLLAVLMIALCVVAMLWQQRRRRRFVWVALAESELASLESDFDRAEITAQAAVSRLSVLMRRSAMAARGRQNVARATDEQWINIIADVGNGQGFGRQEAEMLLQAPYSGKALQDEQILQLLKSCRAWLQGARVDRGSRHV